MRSQFVLALMYACRRRTRDSEEHSWWFKVLDGRRPRSRRAATHPLYERDADTPTLEDPPLPDGFLARLG